MFYVTLVITFPNNYGGSSEEYYPTLAQANHAAKLAVRTDDNLKYAEVGVLHGMQLYPASEDTEWIRYSVDQDGSLLCQRNRWHL